MGQRHSDTRSHGVGTAQPPAPLLAASPRRRHQPARPPRPLAASRGLVESSTYKVCDLPPGGGAGGGKGEEAEGRVIDTATESPGRAGPKKLSGGRRWGRERGEGEENAERPVGGRLCRAGPGPPCPAPLCAALHRRGRLCGRTERLRAPVRACPFVLASPRARPRARVPARLSACVHVVRVYPRARAFNSARARARAALRLRARPSRPAPRWGGAAGARPTAALGGGSAARAALPAERQRGCPLGFKRAGPARGRACAPRAPLPSLGALLPLPSFY